MNLFYNNAVIKTLLQFINIATTSPPYLPTFYTFLFYRDRFEDNTRVILS